MEKKREQDCSDWLIWDVEPSTSWSLVLLWPRAGSNWKLFPSQRHSCEPSQRSLAIFTFEVQRRELCSEQSQASIQPAAPLLKAARKGHRKGEDIKSAFLGTLPAPPDLRSGIAHLKKWLSVVNILWWIFFHSIVWSFFSAYPQSFSALAWPFCSKAEGHQHKLLAAWALLISRSAQNPLFVTFS